MRDLFVVVERTDMIRVLVILVVLYLACVLTAHCLTRLIEKGLNLFYTSFEIKAKLSGDKSWVLFGITSAGSQSCNTVLRDVQPASYTKVAFFLDWIRTQTKGCCE